MYCPRCKRYTDLSHCPECGKSTEEDAAHVVFWCKVCNIPIIDSAERKQTKCPICNSVAEYLCTDLRPVFPEERLLFELMSSKPFIHINKSVWATGGKYYVNGKAIYLSIDTIRSANTKSLIKELKKYKNQNTYSFFNEYIRLFIKANKSHLDKLVRESCDFIVNTSKKFKEERVVISFSGGKDSTVTADLAVRALSNPYLVHIYGDTTLEFPFTEEYAKRFREDHPLAIFKVAKNNFQNFY